MKRREKPSKIYFANEKLRKAFESLKDSTGKNKQLYEWLSRAFKDLEQNAFCGIEIPKKLIPDVYKKYERRFNY